MKYYEAYLKNKSFEVVYIEAKDVRSDCRHLITELVKNFQAIECIEVCDDWLEKRLNSSAHKCQIIINYHPNPSFLNSNEKNNSFFDGRKRYFHNDFYIYQRKEHNVLITALGEPLNGKWSFDEDNRKKYPKNKIAPKIDFKANYDEFYLESHAYVTENFPNNYGELNSNFCYPHTHALAEKWLNNFLQTRFEEFGIYEDALVANESILHHSLLTPILNSGLITPNQVIKETLNYADKNNIPYNSLEGFIRQIIGWREFIRAIYIREGTKQRTKNYWQFKRKIPNSFYTGTTGIDPIDSTIKKLLETGYSHHIERLMVMGNFMLLCEFDPDEVYKWFMELYIDAYDWVMVPNVYGMSQFADGGMMCTKPYISGSNYLFKMSDYPKGEWSYIWDALFWRFMDKHRSFFLKNPRMGMLIRSFDKMDPAKRAELVEKAETYLNNLENATK